MTQCKLSGTEEQGQMSLDLGLGRDIEAKFDGGRISSDGGLLLLRKADEKLELTKLAGICLRDWRRADLVDHSIEQLFQQRIYAIAAGYEDCNDAGHLRFDPMHKLASGLLPDGEKTLASQPTLSRFENSADDVSLQALQKLLVHTYIRTQKKAPKVLRLSMDTTCDEVHGYQQLSFYNGFYKTDCFVPLFIFTEDGFPLAALLRPGNAGIFEGAVRMLRDVIKSIRLVWPNTRIELTADAAFAVREVYHFLEENDITYYMCIKENHALTCLTQELIAECKEEYEQRSGQAHELKHGRWLDQKEIYKAWRQKEERLRFASKEQGRMQEHFEEEFLVKRFCQFKYEARQWPHPRRIIARCQYGKSGPDIRFIVTNSKYGSAEAAYQKYCQRAQCENWIKDLKNYLKCDRTSCQEFNANQFRLLLHTFAYALIWQIKKSARIHHATVETVRLQLFKVGVLVKVTTRKIWLHLASEHPWQRQYQTAWLNL